MKSVLIIFALLLPLSSLAAGISNVPPRTADIIRTTLSDMAIKDIRSTPIPGVYELQVGSQIYYSDKTGRHIINGHIFDTRSKQDLTATRLAELSKIDWSALPLDKAVVSGPEDGLKMAVFTDPDCPYCKSLEEQLGNMDGLRVYTFLYPLTQLHPDAYAKSESIWCAKDQHQAMVNVMTKGTKLPKATCNTPLADIQKLAAKLNVQGTPTIFAHDGRKFGGVPLTQLKTWLQQGK
ncbi:MAG: DsbC family protein [Ghiorsea sp.]